MEIIERSIDLQLPSDRVRMVLMQPFVDFAQPFQAPYQWAADKRAAQIQSIQRTLEIAQGGEENPHAHFTVFPEYSIPGPDGVRAIDEHVLSQKWPNDTIVIGGVDGLTRNDYSEICSIEGASVEEVNSPVSVDLSEWVNTSITWTKDTQGNVMKWIQPKLQPNELERNTPSGSMFKGKSINLFNVKFDNSLNCRFFTLICFDWMAAPAGRSVMNSLLSELNNMWNTGDSKAIHFVFVIQQNSEPNHQGFLQSTEIFLLDNSQFPNVDRQSACVLLANNALNPEIRPRTEGAFSSFVLHPNSPFIWNECRSSVSCFYDQYRNNGGFPRCKSVVFREMGPCVQSADVKVGRFVNANVTGRASAVEGGAVYPLDAAASDPRLPEQPVPACVKWVNDELDFAQSLSRNFLLNRPLATEAQAQEAQVIQELRSIDSTILTKRVRQATWIDISRKKRIEIKPLGFENVDLWDNNEQTGLLHILRTLAIFNLCHKTTVKDSTFHGTLELPDGAIHIVAISGPTHEDCRRHFDQKFSRSPQKTIILVTLDENSIIPTDDEMRKIYEPMNDPGLRLQPFPVLIDSCRRATDQTELRTMLTEILAPNDGKII